MSKHIYECEVHELLFRGPRPEYIYFALLIGSNMKAVKVGISHDPHKRMNQLRNGTTALPTWAYDMQTDLGLLGFVIGDRELERAFHLALREHRLAGEWFDWNEQVETFIDPILSDNCVCNLCMAADQLGVSA